MYQAVLHYSSATLHYYQVEIQHGLEGVMSLRSAQAYRVSNFRVMSLGSFAPRLLNILL